MLLLAALLAQTTGTAAPADRYFGRLKMSALRVRYETMQLKKRYETHELLPEQTTHLLILTQDAFQDWAHAYPKDPWLASTGYAIASLYAELPGNDAHDRAVTLYVYVKTNFPQTRYAAESRTALHSGPPVRSDPAWAKTMRATPVPSPPPSPAGATSPAPPPAAPASASPGASARPTPAAGSAGIPRKAA